MGHRHLRPQAGCLILSKREQGLLIAGGLLVALALFWPHSHQAEAIGQAEAILRLHDAYAKRQAILQDIAQRAKDRASVAIAHERAKDASVRQLSVQLAIDSTARDSIHTLLMVRDTVIAQRDSARAAYTALLLRAVADSSRAQQAEARVAALEQNLRATLQVADCHLIGLRFLPRCPSRNASFVLGAGLTATAFLVTHR